MFEHTIEILNGAVKKLKSKQLSTAEDARDGVIEVEGALIDVMRAQDYIFDMESAIDVLRQVDNGENEED